MTQRLVRFFTLSFFDLCVQDTGSGSGEENALLSPEGPTFLQAMLDGYGEEKQPLFFLVGLVKKATLAAQRAIDFPTKCPELYSKENLAILRDMPHLLSLFQDNDDLILFLSFAREENTALTIPQELHIGSIFRNCNYSDVSGIATSQWSRFFETLVPYSEPQTSALEGALPDHWKTILLAYIASASENPNLSHTIPLQGRKDLETLFASQQHKDFILDHVRSLWRTALESGTPESFPFSLIEISSLVAQCEGAGPLKHIESLTLFFHALRAGFQDKSEIIPTTHKQIFKKQGSLEKRFDKERWSNDDRSYFYALAADIIKVQPRIYSKFLSLAEHLKPKELKMFGTQILPLMHAYLALIDTRVTVGKRKRTAPALIHFEQNLRSFLRDIKQPKADVHGLLEKEKNTTLSLIQNCFKEKFGIKKVPETFDDQSMRSIQNIVRYLANINERDATKETTLTLYLSLLLNGQWEAFRRGEKIELEGLFQSGQQNTIAALMAERTAQTVVTPDILGIAPDDLGSFQKILQRDTELYHAGSTQTIDVKIETMVRGLTGLLDPHIYADALERGMLELMRKNGTVEVNKVLAKLFGRLSGKSGILDPREQLAADEVEALLRSEGKELSAQSVKELQDKGRSPSLLVNIFEYLKSEKVDKLIAELHSQLRPGERIIEIFNTLGEEFTPTSGAQALSQDVDYLQNIIVKRGGDLAADDLALLKEYLHSINQAMEHLEKVYDDIRERFGKLASSQHQLTNERLQKQILDLQRVISNASLEQEITTLMTGNLNEIIENIRACLSCVGKEANNDTNLSFGDPIQFLLMSKSKHQKERGSIADEIVYLFPVTRADGTTELSFVFDKIYGTKSSDMLFGHIETVFKKYQELKKAFPGARLSLFVTREALFSSGLSADTLMHRLEKSEIKVTIEKNDEIDVTVPKSPMGDRYLEFGSDGCRKTGPRKASGISIRI